MKKSLIALVVLCAGAAMAAVASAKEFGHAVVDTTAEAGRTALRVVSNAVNRAFVEYQLLNGAPMAGLITSTTKNAQSTVRGPFIYRHFDDAAVPAAIVLAPGFRPRRVVAYNLTDRIRYEWFDGMAATDCVMTIANGTVTLDTGSKLAVVAAEGLAPSITVAASQVLQNKQLTVIAD